MESSSNNNNNVDKINELSIGEKLKNARLAQGIELEKAAVETKIKKSFLEMLENNQFESLPNLVTARGFMKIYAQYLRLNVQEFINQFNHLYPNEATGANSPRDSSKEIKVGLTVDKQIFFPTGLKQMNNHTFKYTKQTRSRNKRKFFGSLGGAITLVVLALVLISMYFKSSIDSIKTIPRQKSEVNELMAKLTPEQLQTMQTDLTKVYVNAQATSKTYVTTIIDGRLVFRGMMEDGEVKSWEGNQYIKIKASVPRNLRLFVNGFDAGVMANTLTMEEKTYFPGQRITTENVNIPEESTNNNEEKEETTKKITPTKIKEIKTETTENLKTNLKEDTSTNGILGL